MAQQLPPNPHGNAVLKRIYPWGEYDLTLVMQWLYEQAKKTGFAGTYEDFKLRYGAYVETTDPQDIYDFIDNYIGAYQIVPLVGIEQVLKTKNKVMNNDVTIAPIPESLINQYENYEGNYNVTPLARVDQVLHPKEKVLTDNMVIEKIPYAETTNDAGGYTVIIG